MAFESERLRPGEWIAGAGAVLLLVFMFALKWYGLQASVAPTASTLGVSTSVNAWDGLTTLRWLMLVTIAVTLTLVYFQGTRRAPAIPVTFSLFTMLLGGLTLLLLIYRVLINEPGSDDLVSTKLGAYLGLVAAAVIAYGGYKSLRTEGILPKDTVPVEELTVGSGDLGTKLR
jgi:hypothetical protein